MRILRESIPFIVVPLILAGVFLILGLWILLAFCLLVSLFMAFFFRDPQRQPPTDPNLVVAPADGKVTKIQRLADSDDSSTLISIFLSPFDVHINRAPIPGRITDVVYSPGKFLMATNQNASLVNEQNILTIHGDNITVVCKQIAGILARRIVCWKNKGDEVALGERFGLIKFSSRTDVILPPNVSITVSEGVRVQGGITVIGRIS
ncbi:MAG TPA: phosphatidylserine decarboxylase family protein [Pyrinomonadaceae bacterium]|nr:phosphatidylserine decarboxylase family protein [Pyrinomonadaceae bacterium]